MDRITDAYEAVLGGGNNDRIIRDDTEQYFIEQYITLNPLMWEIDRNNPDGQHTGSHKKARHCPPGFFKPNTIYLCVSVPLWFSSP
jgi:hypothetical protein